MELDCETMELDCETIESIVEEKEEVDSLNLCSFPVNGTDAYDSDCASKHGLLLPNDERIDDKLGQRCNNIKKLKVKQTGASNSSPATRARAPRRDFRKNMCGECQLMFINETDLLAHIRKKHPDAKTKASSKSSPTQKKVVAVKQEVNKQDSVEKTPVKQSPVDQQQPQQQYLCEVCPKAFTSINGIRRHELTHNPVYATQRQNEVKDNTDAFKQTCSGDRYICEFCGKDFLHQGQLDTHINIHTLMHKCSECPKRFSNAGYLQNHMRFHAGPTVDQQRKCTKCDRTFKSQAGLDLHDSRQHANSLTYKCELCDNEFPFLSGLRSHQLRVHDGRGRTVLMHDLRNFSLPSV